jgi:NAD(P)-dependent dehydrogenase (short-subunit alcohol dehydrogenase family)
MTERALRLEGKVAIVTGAGSSGEIMGNGKATAIIFAREGAKVLLVDNQEDRVAQTLETITSEGGEASVFVADVSRADDCEAMVNTAVGRYGRLDILHNNVGIGGSGTVLEVSEEDWDRVMIVNLKSMMLTSKYSIPQMISSGGGGSIVNISSISAIRPRGLTAYSVSKGGVIALTQAMAIDHAPDGVRVNCIMPGPVYTSMVARNMTDERRETRRQASPLGIEGTAWDIGYAGLFLASDEARWITGVILPVDGGVTIASPSR